jgi:hypothetical protein
VTQNSETSEKSQEIENCDRTEIMKLEEESYDLWKRNMRKIETIWEYGEMDHPDGDVKANLHPKFQSGKREMIFQWDGGKRFGYL